MNAPGGSDGAPIRRRTLAERVAYIEGFEAGARNVLNSLEYLSLEAAAESLDRNLNFLRELEKQLADQ